MKTKSDLTIKITIMIAVIGILYILIGAIMHNILGANFVSSIWTWPLGILGFIVFFLAMLGDGDHTIVALISLLVLLGAAFIFIRSSVRLCVSWLKLDLWDQNVRKKIRSNILKTCQVCGYLSIIFIIFYTLIHPQYLFSRPHPN